MHETVALTSTCVLRIIVRIVDNYPFWSISTIVVKKYMNWKVPTQISIPAAAVEAKPMNIPVEYGGV